MRLFSSGRRGEYDTTKLHFWVFIFQIFRERPLNTRGGESILLVCEGTDVVSVYDLRQAVINYTKLKEMNSDSNDKGKNMPVKMQFQNTEMGGRWSAKKIMKTSGKSNRKN